MICGPKIFFYTEDSELWNTLPRMVVEEDTKVAFKDLDRHMDHVQAEEIILMVCVFGKKRWVEGPIPVL